MVIDVYYRGRYKTHAREKRERKWFFLGIASNSAGLVHRV